MGKSLDERSRFLRENRLCYGCYQPMSENHNARSCTQRRTCSICKKNHPTSLHGFKVKKDDSINARKTNEVEGSAIKANEVGSCAASLGASNEHVGDVISLCVVLVKVYRDSGRWIETLAMLDNGSQASFMTNNLRRKLGLMGKETSLTIMTLNGTDTVNSKVLENVRIENQAENSSSIILPKVYTRNEIPVSNDDIATKDKLQKWKYLEHISHNFEKRMLKVEMLIGADCSEALEPINVVPSQNGGPYAYETILGWCVVGPIRRNSDGSTKTHICNRIAVIDVRTGDVARHHYEISNRVIEQKLRIY